MARCGVERTTSASRLQQARDRRWQLISARRGAWQARRPMQRIA